MGKDYAAVESFSDCLLFVALLTCVTALRRSQTIRTLSLNELVKFVFSMFIGEEVLVVEDAGHLWNHAMRKGSKEEDQWPRDAGFVCY